LAISVTGLTVHTQNGSGTWTDYGTGGGSTSTTATFLSGTSSRGRKFTGSKGFAFEVNASGTDLSSSIVLVRFLVNGGLGATLAGGGASIRMEDTSGNISDWYIAGSDTYNGGWFEAVIDTANAESANNGTAATLTAIQYVGLLCNAAASSGGDPNVYVDEILSCANTGLTLAGNTTNVFDEAADWDETSLYGIITRRAGVVFSKVPLNLAPDASDHASTDEQLVFEEPIYEDGTNVDSALTLQGLSSSDADNNNLVRLACSVEDNADINGTHASKTLDFSSATDTDLTDCTFRGFNATSNAVQLGTSTNAINGTTFNLCGQVSAGTAIIRDCIFRNTTDSAGAFFYDENSDIADSDFFSDGTGYGIQYRPTGAGPFTETFDNINFTGYGLDDTADSAIHVNPVTNSVTITINVQNANTPTADDRSPYTGTFTIQQTVTVKVTVQDIDGNAIQSARVYMIADTGGDLSAGTEILNADSNASGIVQDTGFNYTNPQPVTGWVRKGTTSPLYKQSPISGTIQNTGLDITVTMVSDE
jgi:hypothetical protein